MPDNYDEVVKKNKKYLTKAQIKALGQASAQYNQMNAGNRAGALSSAREQYDAAYRGLQNMGLAGASGTTQTNGSLISPTAQATSGEVPRLQAQIESPFEAYNRRLMDVENRQLSALGTSFAKATKKARRKAAAARRAAFNAQVAKTTAASLAIGGYTAAGLAQAAQAAKEAQQKSESMHQTAVESRGLAGSTVNADTKRQRNVNQTDTGTGDSGKTQGRVYTNKVEYMADLARQNREARERAQIAYGASAQAQRNEQLALKRQEQAAQAAKRAADRAAARVLGVSVPKNYTETVQQSQAAENMKTANSYAASRNANYDNGDLTGRPKGPTVHTEEQKDARAWVREAEDTLRSTNATIKYGYDNKADKQAYDVAQARVDALEKQMNAAKGAPVVKKPGQANRKPGTVTAMTDSGSEQRGAQGKTAVPETLQQEYQQAIQARDAAKLKAEQPKLYAAYVVAEDPDADPKSREAAKIELAKSWGLTPDERTEEQNRADKKTVAKYAAYLAQYDDAETPEEKNAAEVVLKSMGVTPEEARKFISDHRQAREKNAEYNYYIDALMNQLTYAGKTPAGQVNQQEQDDLYRAVNKLDPISKTPDWMYDETSPYFRYGDQYEVQELEYLTDDERNAYNYIYETKGLDAANQYIKNGIVLRNIRAAAAEEESARKLAQQSPVAANLISVATNSLGNVPAMLEKLVKGTYNYVTGNNNPLFIDTNNSLNRLAEYGNTIRDETSRQILEANKGTSGQIWNFLYQSGMSMADSATAMAFASTVGEWFTDLTFFSSAGNEAYKDAIERGATQEQALSAGFLSGFAEAFFEHASIEHFLNLDYQGKGRVIRNMLSQAGVEASEEFSTEIVNLIADQFVMGDKSKAHLAANEYMEKGMSTEDAYKQALLDDLKGIGMSALGGLVSGLGFGVFGAVPNTISQVSTGREVKAKGYVDSYVRNAQLLGGDAEKLANEVNGTSKPGNRLVGALAQQVNTQVKEIAKTPGKGAAVQTLLTGEKLTTNGAKTVLDALGADTLSGMGYDTSSASALAKSYNAKLQEYNITPRMQETSAARQTAQAIPERRNAAPEFTGAAQEQRQSWSDDEQNKVTAARADAANRVWANPTQGLALTTEDGKTVTPMPGNMTAISFAEQERSKFQTRASATTGNVTYAVAGMQAREGLSNEQTLSEIKKGLTKDARANANVYEKLSSALGVPMVIHDAMVGTNGFIDEDGKMHVVLSGKQSVLRVAAHELTHWAKDNNRAAYDSMRKHLISEVGQDRFDRMIKQKAKEYGIDLSTDKGKTLADDEVCAELCERMLSNEEALEKFAEKDTAAAKTLRDHLLKILNAIKAAFKQASNRDFGDSWSGLIKDQETIESWYNMLQGAVEKAEARAQSTESQATETEAAQATETNAAGDLYMDAETERRQEARKAAEESAQKKTYVRGYTAAEVDKVLAAGVLGDKSNYEGNDYENARGMIAQLIPDVVSALKGEADLSDVNEKVKTAVGVMLDNYIEDTGDLTALREAIPEVIGVDATAKGDLKHQDQSLFQMSSQLSKALGRKVTLVGPTGAQYKTAEKLEELWPKVRDQFGLSEDQDFSVDLTKLLDYVEQEADTLKRSQEVFGSQLQGTIDTIAGDIIDAVSEMYSQKTGERFSLDTDALRAGHQSTESNMDSEPSRDEYLAAAQVMQGLKKKSVNLFSSADIKAAEQVARQYWKDMGTKSPFFRAWFGEWRAHDVLTKVSITPVDTSRGGFPGIEAKNEDTGIIAHMGSKLKGETYAHSKHKGKHAFVMDLVASADSLFKDAILLDSSASEKGNSKSKNTIMMHSFYGVCEYNGAHVPYLMFVEEYYDDTKGPLAHRGYEIKNILPVAGAKSQLSSPASVTKGSINNVAELYEFVKNNDPNFTPSHAVDPALLNKDGTPRVLYHGTNGGDFYAFDWNETQRADAGWYGRGHYFARSEGEAKSYGKRVIPVYLRMSNPFNFAKEVYTLDGAKLRGADVKGASVLVDNVAFMINMSQKFPGIFGNNSIEVRNKETGKVEKLAWKDLRSKLDEVINSDSMKAVQFDDGHYEWQYTPSWGMWGSTTHNEYATKKEADAGKIPAAIDLLFSTQYDWGGMALSPEAYYIGGDMDAADAFTKALQAQQYDGVIQAEDGDEFVVFDAGNIKSATENIGTFDRSNPDIRYSLDLDTARETFTHIDTTALENGLEALKGVTPGKGLWALKDVSRFMDSVAGGDRELRDNLTKIFETPHRQALKNYATGVSEMQQKVLDIGQRAGVCDAKGNHFDSKKSAAIQNIGEGFSNRHTDVSVRVVDADAVRVTATDKETGKALGTKDYTYRELCGAYGREVAAQLWSEAFDAAQKEGGHVDIERNVNTQPYTLQDLKEAYPQDWQKLKAAADEFRTMYDDYIRDINGMLETIYPYASKYATVDKITEAIEKKQQRLADRKAAYDTQIENLQKSLEEKEKEIAGKKRTDTKAYRQLVEQANRLSSQIADTKAEIAEYEANVKDELTVMGEEKALMMNAEREGESLGRMHRLEYRSDYFHHFTEMASGIQNLKSIFTGNTDISPAVVGKTDQTKAKSRFAGFFQQRQGGDYTADALNGMLRYGQLAEYKLAFDPFAAYLRDVEKQVAGLDKNATNRDNLIRYIQQWTNTILGKSHTLDRALVDSGVGMRSKMFKAMNWINSRVIQNTLLWNMRSALIQISNVTNAKGIVTNNLDWANGLRKWALARRGNSEMQAIMNQSTFLASRYMDSLELTESKMKSAKQFAGWLLGALDEVSAKATWWAAYTQYQRNPNAKVIQNAYRTYDNAIDYADDVTRRTHAGRGVGELAPAMTSRVFNLVAPFQVEVNNTYQLLKDNVKQKNYLGLLSTGVSVFALNTVFEAIVGSTPLGFDFIRAIVDIAFGFAGDDPDDDDDDYSVGKAAQRLAGEFVGGLPYANQIVGIIGKDNAEKIIGSDTDVTRYGNTQIGLNALMNTVAGISDIGSAVKGGKNLFTETNFISDIDDLLNIIMPMGGKQLTRTAEGLITMAKGYGGKVDKEGNEKVQFITNNDLVHWLHAGLFGKWSLTEASEYTGEERLLPKLFGAYDGPKSATGKLVDAKEYKAALATGIDGKDYFSLKDDLKGYTTQAGKRAEMMQQKLTPEQKAKLDALMFGGKDVEMKAEGAVVYQKSGDEWKVKADYTNQDMFDLSTNGDKVYTGTLDAMAKTGLPQDQAALAADMWEQTKDAEDRKAAFRDLLRDNKNLTVEQKEALDLQFTGNKYPADYSDPDLYELSTTSRSDYEKAKTAKAKGVSVSDFVSLRDKKKAYDGDGQSAYIRREIMKSNLTLEQKKLMDDLLVSDKGEDPDYSDKELFELSLTNRSAYTKAKTAKAKGVSVSTFTGLLSKKNEYSGEDKSDYMRGEIMKLNLTPAQKELMDDMLVSDKGRNPDYSSPAWFEISMLGGGQYQEAKDGEKIGMQPETYLTVYKKWKTLDAKDENGKTVSGLKKKRAKAYLDGLTVSAPVYDYIWHVMFGYKR